MSADADELGRALATLRALTRDNPDADADAALNRLGERTSELEDHARRLAGFMLDVGWCLMCGLENAHEENCLVAKYRARASDDELGMAQRRRLSK